MDRTQKKPHEMVGSRIIDAIIVTMLTVDKHVIPHDVNQNVEIYANLIACKCHIFQ